MNSLGYIGVYSLLRWHITHEMYESIEHHDVNDYTELIIPISECKNPDHEFIRINTHEFRYKGKMYDIVSQKKVGDSVHFTAIYDPHDEMNFHHLAETVQAQLQTPKNTEMDHSKVVDVMVKGFFSPLFFTKIPVYNSIFSGRHLKKNRSNLLPDSPFVRIPVPPPKIS